MLEDTQKYLQRFADDERTFDAVKDELLLSSYMADIDPNLPNEHLGEEVKARMRAKMMIEAGFKRIKALKTEKLKEKVFNSAR